MNEGAGTTFYNTADGTNNVTFAGGTGSGQYIQWASVPPFTGTVADFYSASATNGGIASNITPTNFTGTAPFSVSIWAVVTAPQTYSAIIGNIGNSGYSGWELGVGGTLQVVIMNTYGSSAIVLDAGSGLTTNVLYHLVFTYDGSQHASGVNVYANATLQTNAIGEDNLTSSAAVGEPVAIGARGSNLASPFVGGLKDARIYGAVLTSAQISTLYSSGPV